MSEQKNRSPERFLQENTGTALLIVGVVLVILSVVVDWQVQDSTPIASVLAVAGVGAMLLAPLVHRLEGPVGIGAFKAHIKSQSEQVTAQLRFELANLRDDDHAHVLESHTSELEDLALKKYAETVEPLWTLATAGTVTPDRAIAATGGTADAAARGAILEYLVDAGLVEASTPTWRVFRASSILPDNSAERDADDEDTQSGSE